MSTDTDTAAPAETAVAAVIRFFDYVDAADYAGAVGLFAPDSVYLRPGYDPILGTEGLARFFAQDRPIASGTHLLSTVLTVDGTVAVHGEFHGLLRDGSPVDLRFADFFQHGPTGFVRRDTFFFSPLV